MKLSQLKESLKKVAPNIDWDYVIPLIRQAEDITIEKDIDEIDSEIQNELKKEKERLEK